jgi:hypothetical protein
MEPAFYKSPLLRYYKLYTVRSQESKEIWVRMHSNKLFLIFLHPTHPAMRKNIKQVIFRASAESLSGKRKKGALNLQPSSPLLEIHTEDEIFQIRAGIFGKLIETNDYLLQFPNTLKDAEGFLVVLMPPLNKIDSMIKDLLDPEVIN